MLPLFFNDTATTEIYTLSLHDALPIWPSQLGVPRRDAVHRRGAEGLECRADDVRALPPRAHQSRRRRGVLRGRSEEHTSELQSQSNLVCRLLLEKKKKNKH